jgi:hypothetical protein
VVVAAAGGVLASGLTGGFVNHTDYALLCFVNDRSGGPPHVIKAKMIQEVKVP